MFKLAQVTKVYPGARKVDLVFLDSRLPVASVKIMTGAVGSDFGSWNIPAAVQPENAQQVGSFNQSGRNIIAVCGFIGARGERPIVMGFLKPAGSVVSFTQDNREVHLHPSGTYTTVAPDGSFEVYNPNGGYIRIGTGAHEAPAAFSSGSFPAPASPAVPTITVSNGQGGLTMDPSGHVTLSGVASVALEAPAITAGAVGATNLRLATETFVLDVYNAHGHPALNTPPTQQASGGDMTATFKAS
jgi:hypothetical protein